MPPFALAAARFFFAAVPLVFFIKRPQIPWRFVVCYGFLIGVCQFGLLFLGMKLGMSAGLSSLVIQVQVFFTIGLGIAYLGDRLSTQNLVGAVIAAAGIALLAAYKMMSGATSTLIGFVLVLIAALAWASGNVVAKRAAGAP
jgi:O-acetylserine/cysteine efflux transporter